MVTARGVSPGHTNETSIRFRSRHRAAYHPPVVSRATQIALFAALVFFSIPAGAEDDKAEARRLFEEGVSLAKEEKWAEALARFEASRDLVERPSTLFNIGTTLMRLERPTAATGAFERFLALSDRSDRKAAARKMLEEARAAVVEIELRIEPQSASLTVDGEVVARDGPVRKLSLDPGERKLEVRAEGYGGVTETIALPPGARLERTIALEPIAPPPPPVASTPPPAPLAPPVEVKTTPEEESSVFESPWFWVITGVVVVGAAVGVGVGVGTRGTKDPYGGTGNGVIMVPPEMQ